MKIEIDVLGIPEGYEATTGRFTPYSEGPGRMWGWIDLRKAKREVICFVPVDEFVESTDPFPAASFGWGLSKKHPGSPFILYPKTADPDTVQWYRREVRLEE